jgi:hypothetical protein
MMLGKAQWVVVVGGAAAALAFAEIWSVIRADAATPCAGTS